MEEENKYLHIYLEIWKLSRKHPDYSSVNKPALAKSPDLFLYMKFSIEFTEKCVPHILRTSFAEPTNASIMCTLTWQ